MYSRLLKPPHKSFFLFGPRGTGKTSWLQSQFPQGLYLDLLDSGLYTDLLARPERLEGMIPGAFKDWVLLDEVQRIPDLLNEVHRLIEKKKYRFALTGSSARKLRRGGVNLLAGRALTYGMYPLTAGELQKDFHLKKSLEHGHLPSVFQEEDPMAYLQSYVGAYLREEVLQEGLTRNLGAFSRFLESASFSQASPLNISGVARECGVERKVVEEYFRILEDLLLAARIPIFSRRAKRRLVSHSKFYFFDCGVFRAIRPSGPLDSPEEIEGAALETLVFQEIRAMNAYQNLGYQIFYWRTADGQEVDIVLYGKRGIKAFEVKRSSRIQSGALSGLAAFGGEYPSAQRYLLYGGKIRRHENGVEIIPLDDFFADILTFL